MIRGAQPGALVKIYMDTAKTIEPEDQITTRAGKRYEVVKATRVQRGPNAGRRTHMVCRVMAPEEPDLETVHLLWWYSR